MLHNIKLHKTVLRDFRGYDVISISGMGPNISPNVEKRESEPTGPLLPVFFGSKTAVHKIGNFCGFANPLVAAGAGFYARF